MLNEMSVKRIQVAAVGMIALLWAMPAWSLTETGRVSWQMIGHGRLSFVIPLLLTAVLYGIGITKMLRRTTRRRSLLWPIFWFALGWISLVIALDSPLHELGEQLFWVHMTQHEILMLISAPLLVLGRPSNRILVGHAVQSGASRPPASGAQEPLRDSGPSLRPRSRPGWYPHWHCGSGIFRSCSIKHCAATGFTPRNIRLF